MCGVFVGYVLGVELYVCNVVHTTVHFPGSAPKDASGCLLLLCFVFDALLDRKSFFFCFLDGSKDFWSSKLQGVLDEEDIAEAASKFSAAGLKQKHVGNLSRDDLKEAGLKYGVIKDFLDKQRSLMNAGCENFECMHQ